MSRNNILAIVRTITILGDTFLINIGIIAAFALRFAGTIPNENWPAYVITAPWITILALVLFKIYGLYGLKDKKATEVFLSLICVVFLNFVGIMAISFLFRGFAFPRTVIFIAPFTQLIFLVMWRFLILFLEQKLTCSEKILIVGQYQEAQQMAKKIISSNQKLTIEGLIIEHKVQITNKNHFPVIGEYVLFPDIVSNSSCRAILFCSSISRDQKNSFINIALAHNKQVLVIPDFYEILLAQAKIDQFGDTPIFQLSNFQIDENNRLFKRAIDLILSGIGLLLLCPLMLLVSLAIRFDSKGPIFYSQERVSENGKVFRLHKFRSMVQDAEKTTGPILSVQNDPRITKLGRFLRASRIDELPQLLNILKGDMSIVGPRPERPYFVEQFNKEVPHYAYRQKVKSGLTGLAQVEGKYSSTPEDKLRYDLLYAKDYSPLKDLKIILQTLKVILMKDKSA